MESEIANWVTGATVVAATFIYGAAAAQAFNGTVPGPYVSLLAYAPIGLMATSIPLMYSVFRIVVPDGKAAAMIALAALSGTAFQASVLNGARPRDIGILALINLAVFYYAAKKQGALTSSDRKARYDSRRRIAEAIELSRRS